MGTWLEPCPAESVIIIIKVAAAGHIFSGVFREFLDRRGAAAWLGGGTLVESIPGSFGNGYVLIIIVIDYPNRFVRDVILRFRANTRRSLFLVEQRRFVSGYF